MATLNIALKANQASALPALLVATYSQRSSTDATLNINYKDTETLEPDAQASVELEQGASASIYGCENVINELLSNYTSLQGKHENLVRCRKAKP